MLSVLLTDVFSVVHLLAIVLLGVMLFRPELRDAFARRCVGSAAAVDLAYIRIVTCAILIVYVLSEDLTGYARMGAWWIHWPGQLAVLGRGWLKFLLASEAHTRVFTAMVLGALTLAMLGVATRVTVPLATLLYLVFAGLLRGFGKYFHEGYIGLYVMLVLSFLPTGDAWSVDARWLRRKRDDQVDRKAAYGWGVYACYAAAAVPYLQLSFSKLVAGGLYWFDGRSLRNYMITDDLNLTEWQIDLALRFPHTPTMLFTVAGFFALATEFTYPLVLVVPRLRRILPLCVAMMHLGVWFGQDALFLDAILIPLIFVKPSRWLEASR
jgi:hypothetical protein